MGKTAKAIGAYIFRNKFGGSSNNGISQRFDEVLILHERGNNKVDLENPPENLCEIIIRNIGARKVFHVQPVENGHIPSRWSFGGTYVGCSDARFNELFDFYGALPLHDRKEC